jgi:hypothetical protein
VTEGLRDQRNGDEGERHRQTERKEPGTRRRDGAERQLPRLEDTEQTEGEQDDCSS